MLTISDDTPLYLSLDHHHGICLEAKLDNFAYYYDRFNLPSLNYSICTGGKNSHGEGDLKQLHQHFLPKSFLHEQRLDDLRTLESVLNKPIWQVPVVNGKLSHDSIKNHIKNKLNFRNPGQDRGYLLLDHHWQRHMGDLEFDPKEFPRLEETITMIK